MTPHPPRDGTPDAAAPPPPPPPPPPHQSAAPLLDAPLPVPPSKRLRMISTHSFSSVPYGRKPSAAVAVPPTTSTDDHRPAHERAPAKEGRRMWTRRMLEQSGVSDALLSALDTYIERVPPIPTNMDPSRKIYVRNMRGWILHLGLPAHEPVWDSLISVLRTDSSVSVLGQHWDHDLCRFILGKLILDNQTKQLHPNQPKQTRQASNNAIKRELTCPNESGTSSRGKTFRDLFREKCLAASVKLPPLESSARTTKRITVLSDKSTPPLDSHPFPIAASHASPFHHGPSISRVFIQPSSMSAGGGEDSYVSIPHSYTGARSHAVVTADGTELARLRASCPHKDEWLRTAWWRLSSDDDINLLPLLLAQSHLFELRCLLLDFRWVLRTFECVDYSGGMSRFPTAAYDVMLKYADEPEAECAPIEIESFRLIRNAIMLILPILSQEAATNNGSVKSSRNFAAHLATQLVGRLLDHKRRFPNIACFIQNVQLHAPRPWLRPLTRCFHQPRTDIKLTVPSNGIRTPHLIVLSEDGTLLVTSGTSTVTIKPEPSASASGQRTNGPVKDSSGPLHVVRSKVSSIVIWDVQTGKCVCKGLEVPNLVRHLSLSRDNNCIIGETVDGLYFWHLDKKKDIWTISSTVEATPRIKSLSSITPAGTAAFNVLTTHRISQEPMIVLWDVKTGHKLNSYDCVASHANCVDVSAGGDYFASGHDNGFIHLWTMKEKIPVLSFRNEGADRGQQQVVGLGDVNRARTTQFPTISISFFEKGEERWLTAVSANEVIRVWLLPPRHISADQWKSFVSSRRTAVLKCPRIRDVQWSQDGSFVTGGDDGIARMWKREENGKWEWYAINKEDGERSLELSTVLLSCGKRSQYVATYLTKAPSVTVWNMARHGRETQVRRRRSLYQAYLPEMRNSVDATDIGHLTALERAMSGGRQQAGMLKDSKWMSTYSDNIAVIRTALNKFFTNLDTKNTTIPDGEMQPWLRMQTCQDSNGLEDDGREVLRICFELPVITGQSGVLKVAAGMEDKTIGEVCGEVGGDVEDEWTEDKMAVERRGLVAALQDGSIALFELEGVREDEDRRNGARHKQELTDMVDIKPRGMEPRTNASGVVADSGNDWAATAMATTSATPTPASTAHATATRSPLLDEAHVGGSAKEARLQRMQERRRLDHERNSDHHMTDERPLPAGTEAERQLPAPQARAAQQPGDVEVKQPRVSV